MARSEHPRVRRSIGVAVCLAVLAGPVAAQDTGGFSGRATVGIVTVPEYEGAEDRQTFPLLSLRYQPGERWIEFEGTTLRANLLASGRLSAGPVLRYRFGRDDGVSDSAVAALPEIDAGAELGVFLRTTLDMGTMPVDLSAEILADVSGVHDSWSASLGAGHTTFVGERWRITAGAGIDVIGDGYAETHYGVTAAGAAASGLPAYRPDGGLAAAGLTLNLGYGLGPGSEITGLLVWRRLLGDAADSPITERGSADQLLVGLGYTWLF